MSSIFPPVKGENHLKQTFLIIDAQHEIIEGNNKYNHSIKEWLFFYTLQSEISSITK